MDFSLAYGYLSCFFSKREYVGAESVDKTSISDEDKALISEMVYEMKKCMQFANPDCLKEHVLEKLEAIGEKARDYLITHVMKRREFSRKALPSRRKEQMEVLVKREGIMGFSHPGIADTLKRLAHSRDGIHQKVYTTD